jgi:uncharacterized protein (TIGR02145 family)
MKMTYKIAAWLLISNIIYVLLLSSCKVEEVPMLQTARISNIFSTTAASGGNITDPGSSLVIKRGICWSSSPGPTINNNKSIEIGGTGSFTSIMEQLIPNTTYYVRAYATNSEGTGYGTEISFTTLGQAPSALDQSITKLTTDTATISVTIIGFNLPTIVYFEYGTSVSYGHTVPADQSPVTGYYYTSVSKDIGGMAAATTYHIRTVAVNSAGTTYGDDITFTTPGQVPFTSTKAVTEKTINSAVLSGTVNPNYLTTDVIFEYGRTISYGSFVDAWHSPMSGSESIIIVASISNLETGATYHYRTSAVNSLGTTYGNDMTFTTLGQVPTSTTKIVSAKTATSVTLNGTVNPNYLETTITFEYGTSVGYGSSVSALPTLLSGSTSTNVSVGISGLSCATTYHYRVKAVNFLGTTYGNDITFTTLGQAPMAVTKPASGVQMQTAILNGNATANYLSTAVTFEYGLTTSYGSTVSATQSPLSGSTGTNVSVNLSGLLEDTIYYFRTRAENALGISFGDEMVFRTLGKVVDSDGNIYSTVSIGNRIWLAENLKTTKYNDGTSIPLVIENTVWDNLPTPGYCWYENNEATYKDTYGALYNWFTVNTLKLCPIGWHVPTTFEWNIGSSGVLKEAGTAHWQSPNTGASNSTGFTALPGGYRPFIGLSQDIGYRGYWWTSGQNGETNAFYHLMQYNSSNLTDGWDSKWKYFSVRCIRDYRNLL